MPLAIAPATQGRVYGGGCGWLSLFGIAVPDRPVFEGARLYVQMLYPSPGTNPLGLVVTNALELTVGSAPHFDSAAVFGDGAASVAPTRTDFAPVVWFTGAFH